MTLGEAKTQVLHLLDEKTDKDYRKKLSGYFDLGQRKLATQVSPIRRVWEAEASGEALAPPEDFYQLTRVLKREGDTLRAWAGYFWVGRELCLTQPGSYRIEYNAYPKRITDETPDSMEFELRPEAQDALPFFVAAQCMIKENDQRPYYTFTEEYNSILLNLSDTPRGAEILTEYGVS